MAIRKTGLFKHTTLKVKDDAVTRASELSVRQSILPIILVTTLYFLWVSHPQQFLIVCALKNFV